MNVKKEEGSEETRIALLL